MDDEDNIRDLIAMGLRYDGFEVCRRLQSDGEQAPAIFLTARKGMEDKLAGLTIGGDDYLPFG